MKQETNLLPDLWQYLNDKKLNKIEEKVYNWLNRDSLNTIQSDGNIFYFEKTCSYIVMPNYIYNWLIKWVKKNYKLTYLYDL